MKKKELIEKTDKAIAELVRDKVKLRKAYNYYNCKRDKEQFLYLEENYGIGLPTSVEFIPLIKKHIDAIIGEYLDIPIIPKISCKDKETINNIFRDKQIKIAQECYNLLLANLKNNMLRFLGNKDMVDLNIKEQLDKLVEDINDNFVSEYEIASQNIVQYIIQSRNIDLVTKLKLIFLDLLVTGYTFYRAIPSPSGTNIEVECLSPLDTFPELDYNSPYVNDSRRVVVRKFLTRNQILNKYGKELSKEDIAKVKELWRDHLETSNSFYVVEAEGTFGIRAGEEVSPEWPDTWFRYDNQEIPVYEVEWIEVDKNFVEQRYSTIRIGNEIYILKGRDDQVVRTKDAPDRCKLTVNGVYFTNRSKEPYSLMLNAMIILDKYDIAIFYRDKLIANSGSVGDWINMPTLPAFLGDDLPERIMKWLAYKKQGIGLIDTSQEGQVGTGQAPLNTMFNGFDDTIKVQAVQAILLVIDSLEQTASSITGVFKERLNGILLRDAVTNVQVGINNSFTITKLWTFLLDLVLKEILLDSLNCAKIVYSKGLTGVILLGKLQKTFTALPKYFTVTDFDIHIITSSEITKEIELIRQIIPEFVKGNIVGPDIIMDIITAKSLTEMKSSVSKAIKKLKEENNQLQQLTQLNEELQNNMQQMLKQLDQALRKIEYLNELKIRLEQTEIQLRNQVEMFKAQTDRAYKENKAENDTKRTLIEYMLLFDGNPYNDKVKNI